MNKRTQSDKALRDKALRDKAFKTASNPKYNGYQGGLASIVHKFFAKNSTGSGIKSISNQQHANELPKPIIRKLKNNSLFIIQRQYMGCSFRC